MRNVTKMEIANARKAISRNKGNAYGLKVCVSLITVELLRTTTFLADSTTATSLQQPLSSIPKVAFEEGFNFNYTTSYQKILYAFYILLNFVSLRAYISLLSHTLPTKTIKDPFTCHLVLLTYIFFLAPSKIKGDAYSTKPSGHVTLLTSVLLGGLALTGWILRLLLLSLLMFCEFRWNSFDFPYLDNTHVHSLIKCIDSNSVWSCCYFRKGKVRCNPLLKTALDFLSLFYPKKGKLCRLWWHFWPWINLILMTLKQVKTWKFRRKCLCIR